MGVPAAETQCRRPYSHVRANELPDGLQLGAEASVGVCGAVLWRILRGISRSQGVHGGQGVTGAVFQRTVSCIQCLQQGFGFGFLRLGDQQGEVLDAVHGDGGGIVSQGAWCCISHAQGVEDAEAVIHAVVQVTPQPAAEAAAVAGKAALHEILGFEVGVAGRGRATGMDDGQFPGLVQGQQGDHTRMETEETIEVQCALFISRRCDGQAGAQAVVVAIPVGWNYVETIGGASEKHADDVVGAVAGIGGKQQAGRQGAGGTQAGDFQEISAGKFHRRLLL